MGNILGRKRAQIMKITGKTVKLKTPATAGDALRDHPGHVLLDSDAVKRFGVRATPLGPEMGLRPDKVYFLVELQRFPDTDATLKPHAPPPRRVRSGINMTARDRLECLMLARRSVSDITVVRRVPDEAAAAASGGGGGKPVRVKVRIPRAEMERLVEESGDDGEVAEKILGLYIGSAAAGEVARGVVGEAARGVVGEAARGASGMVTRREGHWRPELDSVKESLRGGALSTHN